MSPPDTISDDSKVRRLRFQPSDAARFREIDGEAVLLHLEKGLYYRLNSSATLIWQSLSEGLTLGALCDRFQLSQEIDGDRLWKELLDLVRDLEDEGLLEPRSEAPG